MAAAWYDAQLELHQRLASKVKSILEEILYASRIQFDRVSARVKTRTSFLKKADKRVGGRIKYATPTEEILDVVGVRVITYLDSTVKEVGKLIDSQFDVDAANSIDKGEDLGTDRVGYRSKHYLARLGAKRRDLVECAEFKNIPFEIQVRSLLQHAWAELEHDRRFKYPGELPDDIKRSFSLLAGQLESADLKFNDLAREIDQRAARTARAAAGPAGSKRLTIVNATEYLRGVLAQYLPSGRVEPGIGGDGAKELIDELARFGITTLGGLAKLFPRNFTARHPELLADQTTFIGLLRDAMIFADAERYFDAVWKKQQWQVMSQANIDMFKKYGVEIEPLLVKYKVLREEDLAEDEHDEYIEWVDGPKHAINRAIEHLDWDFEARKVRAGDVDDHGQASEFETRDELVAYLNEVGFEPYNNSAPRDSGEWAFPYDDSMAEDLLSGNCAEQLEHMGWE